MPDSMKDLLQRLGKPGMNLNDYQAKGAQGAELSAGGKSGLYLEPMRAVCNTSSIVIVSVQLLVEAAKNRGCRRTLAFSRDELSLEWCVSGTP